MPPILEKGSRFCKIYKEVLTSIIGRIYRKGPLVIVIKTPAEIEKVRASCRLAVEVLKMIEPRVKPGCTTLELNDICHDFIVSRGAVPAPLNYKGYPKSICTSVNEVVCHGIPSAKQILREGDIINVDITTILDGYHGDTSRTFFVGDLTKIRPTARALVECTEECLERGIAAVRDGCRIGDIGAAIESQASKCGFSVVREFVGHGLGRSFHEDPQIPHFGRKGEGLRLQKGMVFTIEPMINEGVWKTKIKRDGWTAVTEDGKLSAQFEHTVAIMHDGSVDVLTRY